MHTRPSRTKNGDQELGRPLIRLAILVTLFGAVPAHAGPVLIGDTRSIGQPALPGGNGLIGITLQNLTNTTLNISTYSFEVDIADSHIIFTGTTCDGHTLLFAGNSLFCPTLNHDPPGQKMDGADTAATPGSFTAVVPNATFVLGVVYFSVASDTPVGSKLPWTINPAFTSLTDKNGNSITFNVADNFILVTPEPATWGSVALGLALVASRLRRRSF